MQCNACNRKKDYVRAVINQVSHGKGEASRPPGPRESAGSKVTSRKKASKSYRCDPPSPPLRLLLWRDGISFSEAASKVQRPCARISQAKADRRLEKDASDAEYTKRFRSSGYIEN